MSPSIKSDEPTAILIVDEDLGRVWWLSEILHNAGCTVVPALDCRQALHVTKELNINLNLVLVDPALSGVSFMIETLRQRQQTIKVVYNAVEI